MIFFILREVAASKNRKGAISQDPKWINDFILCRESARNNKWVPDFCSNNNSRVELQLLKHLLSFKNWQTLPKYFLIECFSENMFYIIGRTFQAVL